MGQSVEIGRTILHQLRSNPMIASPRKPLASRRIWLLATIGCVAANWFAATTAEGSCGDYVVYGARAADHSPPETPPCQGAECGQSERQLPSPATPPPSFERTDVEAVLFSTSDGISIDRSSTGCFLEPVHANFIPSRIDRPPQSA